MRRADGYDLTDQDLTDYVATLCTQSEKIVTDTTTDVTAIVLPHPSGLPQLIEIRSGQPPLRCILYPASHSLYEPKIDPQIQTEPE